MIPGLEKHRNAELAERKEKHKKQQAAEKEAEKNKELKGSTSASAPEGTYFVKFVLTIKFLTII